MYSKSLNLIVYASCHNTAWLIEKIMLELRVDETKVRSTRELGNLVRPKKVYRVQKAATKCISSVFRIRRENGERIIQSFSTARSAYNFKTRVGISNK